MRVIYSCSYMNVKIFYSVRISNELGKGDAKTASFSVKVAIITATIIGTFFFIICLLFSHGITKIFTSSEEVISSVSSLSVLLALSVFLNGLQAVLSGVAVGAGRQTLVAYVNLCCYYIIGIPVGVLLAYVADMKVKVNFSLNNSIYINKFYKLIYFYLIILN